jgi:hypothetical protein
MLFLRRRIVRMRWWPQYGFALVFGAVVSPNGHVTVTFEIKATPQPYPLGARRKEVVTAATTLPLRLASGGGAAAIFTPLP